MAQIDRSHASSHDSSSLLSSDNCDNFTSLTLVRLVSAILAKTRVTSVVFQPPVSHKHTHTHTHIQSYYDKYVLNN